MNALDDQESAKAFAATRDEESFPAEIVARLVAGESPVKVFRSHRGLSIRALAGASGLSSTLVSDIETGKLTGSVSALKALAAALDVDLDDIA
jgi:ribosome-binding protein aMBF1 (putative translation factor)